MLVDVPLHLTSDQASVLHDSQEGTSCDRRAADPSVATLWLFYEQEPRIGRLCLHD